MAAGTVCNSTLPGGRQAANHTGCQRLSALLSLTTHVNRPAGHALPPGRGLERTDLMQAMRPQPAVRVRSGLPRWTWPPEYKAALCMHLQSFQHPSSGLQARLQSLASPTDLPPTPSPSTWASPHAPGPPLYRCGTQQVRTSALGGRAVQTQGAPRVCPLESHHLPASWASPARQCLEPV